VPLTATIQGNETGMSVEFITSMRGIYDVGLTVGNSLAGRFADPAIDRILT
jgi:hypothetical protein